MADMSEILRKCFDCRSTQPKSSSRVVGTLFSSVKIESSNAACSTPFSEAYIDYKIGWELPIDWFWCDAIVEIVNNYSAKKSDNLLRDRVVTGLTNCVLEFLGDEDNLQHLKKVRSAVSECEIQAILAHHLFAQLASSSEYVIDGKHTDLTKCPACEKDLNLGNTSIGHHKVWYGFPGILIDRTTVKIEMNDIEEEDTEEYEWEGPATKKLKVDEINVETGGDGSGSVQDVFTTAIEVKKDGGFSSEKALQQAFAQTITNAFYQAKENPKLRDLCIPSFLISDAKLKIMMYNVEQDRLYVSADTLYLWDSDDNLNVGTVICLWLALNYEHFQNCVHEDELGTIGIEKSTFKANLPKNILSIYQNELTRCLPLRKKKNSGPSRVIFNSGLLMSKYAVSVQDKLLSMVNNNPNVFSNELNT